MAGTRHRPTTSTATGRLLPAGLLMTAATTMAAILRGLRLLLLWALLLGLFLLRTLLLRLLLLRTLLLRLLLLRTLLLFWPLGIAVCRFGAGISALHLGLLARP